MVWTISSTIGKDTRKKEGKKNNRKNKEMSESSWLTGVLILIIIALLIWAIYMTQKVYSTKGQEGVVRDVAPESIVATTSGIRFHPGILLRNKNFALVFQTDGNLVIFEGPATEKTNTIKSRTMNQKFTEGSLVYSTVDNTTTVNFISSDIPTNEFSVIISTQQSPGTLRLTEEGILQLVTPDSRTININLDNYREIPGDEEPPASE